MALKAREKELGLLELPVQPAGKASLPVMSQIAPTQVGRSRKAGAARHRRTRLARPVEGLEVSP